MTPPPRRRAEVAASPDDLEIIGPGDRPGGGSPGWTVATDRRGRPTTVVLRRGAMVATQDLGGPSHVVQAGTARGAPGTGAISIYEVELCTVIEVAGRIGVIPATTPLHRVVRLRPDDIEHLLTADGIIYPAVPAGSDDGGAYG